MNDSPTEIRMKMARLAKQYCEPNVGLQCYQWTSWTALVEHNELQTLLEAMEND